MEVNEDLETQISESQRGYWGLGPRTRPGNTANEVESPETHNEFTEEEKQIAAKYFKHDVKTSKVT